MNKITNYKIQITNKLQITNYKLQTIHLPKERQVPNDNVRNYKQKTKGGHGLHKDSFKLQTMTAFNQKLLRGVQGDGFLEKSPPGR